MIKIKILTQQGSDAPSVPTHVALCATGGDLAGDVIPTETVFLPAFRTCTACKVEKSIKKFSKCGGGKRRTQCSPCITVKRRKYQKEYHSAYDSSKYYRNNKKKVAFRNLIKRVERDLKFHTFNPYYKYLHESRGIERQSYLNSLKFKSKIKKFNRKFHASMLKQKRGKSSPTPLLRKV